MKTLTVKLSSSGNPDLGQYAPVSPEKTVKVASIWEASLICENYISEYNLGGGNWTGGQVFDGETQIARISYNGRMWDMQNQEVNPVVAAN